MVKLLAVLCITILAFVNCWDVKWATTIQVENSFWTIIIFSIFFLQFSSFFSSIFVKWATTNHHTGHFSQDLFTYAKLFALFVIIVTGVVQLCRGKVNTGSHQG